MIKDFFKASFQDEQQAIVDKAQALASKITEEPKKTRASVYVKTMQKVWKAVGIGVYKIHYLSGSFLSVL